MTRSPNRLFALIVGAIYLVLGFAGFAATTGVGFADTAGGPLLGVFEVNPLQNVLHIVIGAALALAGVSSVAASRRVNAIVGAIFLALGIFGLFVVGTPANVLALSAPDQVLHLASAVVLLAAGLGADRPARAATA